MAADLFGQLCMPGIEFFVSTLFPSWYKNVETAESQSASAANTLMIIRVPNSFMHVYLYAFVCVIMLYDYVYLCVYVCVYKQVYVCMYIYTYMYDSKYEYIFVF